MRFKKLRLILGIFLTIFILVVGNTIAFGLLHEQTIAPINSPNKDLARQKISAVLFWVACAIESESEGGLGLTLNDAFNRAADLFPHFEYTPEMIEKYWYQKDKVHMQNSVRSFYDQDSPL